MKKTSWILAVVFLCAAILAVIAGYLWWHTAHRQYDTADMLEISQVRGQSLKGPGEGGQSGDAQGGQSGNVQSGQSGNAQSGQNGNAQGGQNGNAQSGQGGSAQIGQSGNGTGSQNGNVQDSNGQYGQSGNAQSGQGGNTRDNTGTEDSTIHFVFAGDILLSDHVLGAYDKAGNIGGVVDQGFRSVIDSSDIFMVNEEFPFSDRGSAAPDKQFTFRIPPARVSLLKEMGIDLVTIANNHTLDFGKDALLDTCRTLDDAGILRVGAGADLDEAKKPVIMEIKGKTVGFLGASRVIPTGSWNATAHGAGLLTTYDPKILLEEIKKAKETCDFVIVYVHWGIERDDHPQDYQRALGKQYIDAGADMVIGSHPHVLQGIEYYKGKPIVYSLGNFVFGSSIPKTALLKANWDGGNLSLSFVPGTSSGGYTRAFTEEGEKQAFYQYMTSISYGAVIDENGCREE